MLCRLDSDGDGMTNGQELGDPNCKWRKGRVPARSTNITHPGICDPWDANTCSQSWLDKHCDDTPFVCNAKEDNDTKSFNVVLNSTKIPQELLSSMCQTFNVPAMIGEGDFHLVAAEPIVDQKKYVNMIRLFGCREDKAEFPNPKPCAQVDTQKCQTLLVDWTIGEQGQCFGNDTSKQIGTNGYKILHLSVVYLNIKSETGIIDQSGMKLYYK